MVINTMNYIDKINNDNDKAFFIRMWSQPIDIYKERLKAIGFSKHNMVLDAGSGYAQWSIALATLNNNVIGIDENAQRVAISKIIAKDLNIDNVSFYQRKIERLDHSNYFDAIFSYSTLYLTDINRSLQLMYNALKKNGLLYINSNGLGWYLYNLIETHNDTDDFSSREMAIETLENTLNYLSFGLRDENKQIVTPKKYVLQKLMNIGFQILSDGADGTINLHDCKPLSFYKESYCSQENVWEVLCKK